MSEGDYTKLEIAKLTEQFGTVPPPWVAFPDTHPYGICWRMGAGESYLLLWFCWWESQRSDDSLRVDYFRKWLPPPRWLGWTIDAIWDLQPSDDGDMEAHRSAHWERAEALGLGSQANYQIDLEDPKWLE